MCGRYVLALQASQVRARFADYGMPVEEAPEDEDVRQSYNVAPGYSELVYRADVPDLGPRTTALQTLDGEQPVDQPDGPAVDIAITIKYKLQSMKWGLVPSWTKQNPDYTSMLKTINCRDDSLIADGGMWTNMKQKKRCAVVCEGFYEWLKKNDGKERVPYYTKRRDGQLMCFAGLWDCVQYEGSSEKLYTYTIITTSSNPHLKFLHDRMPVILENGSQDMRTWLNPGLSKWSPRLQSLLRPYTGDLETYAVKKEVGKVGNNSPTFIIPVSSTENKSNIKNFFANAKSKDFKPALEIGKEEHEGSNLHSKIAIQSEDDDLIQKGKAGSMEDIQNQLKRKLTDQEENQPAPYKIAKTTPRKSSVPQKPKSYSAMGNNPTKSPSKAKAGAGSQKITNFFH
ncbi:MAG: hypothetical protein M1829_002184 [Trizodia sp. TS-e1964]|nr:MAG: hypothetical protein M1829_002184 [Trizodia sp. TS-e1964]